MNSAPVTLPCTSSTTATGACAAANPVKPTKTTIAANKLFIPKTSINDLNKSIFLAQTDLTIADGGVADNPSIGMNGPESPPRKPENLLMVIIDESVLWITLSSNVP
jgi:hypothetical protein